MVRVSSEVEECLVDGERQYGQSQTDRLGAPAHPEAPTNGLPMSAVERTPVGIKASRCPQRHLVHSLHVHIGAIEHGEAGIAPLEREEKIRAAEQNDLGALLPA